MFRVRTANVWVVIENFLLDCDYWLYHRWTLFRLHSLLFKDCSVHVAKIFEMKTHKVVRFCCCFNLTIHCFSLCYFLYLTVIAFLYLTVAYRRRTLFKVRSLFVVQRLFRFVHVEKKLFRWKRTKLCVFQFCCCFNLTSHCFSLCLQLIQSYRSVVYLGFWLGAPSSW